LETSKYRNLYLTSLKENCKRNHYENVYFCSLQHHIIGIHRCFDWLWGANSSSNSSGNSNVAGDSPEENTSSSSKQFTLGLGIDANSKAHPLLSLNPGGPGGSPNQGLRGGDIIVGAPDQDDILIGGLGVDVLVADTGDDILIGGTEDFNSNVDGDDKGADNRDRAFGNAGNDTFIWAPGDGSDFFDGGEGTDVLIFGVLGELQDSSGSTEGAPFFNVNPPTKEGSQDFDGIFLDENNLPIVSVSTSPGFCSVVDKTSHETAFESLDVDNIVRFSLRAIANAFDAAEREDDDGLRVAVSTRNVEYLVCTEREMTESGGFDNIQVLDLTTVPPTVALLSELPEYVVQMIQ